MRIYIIIIAFFIYEIANAQKVWSFNDCLTYARENNLQVLASKLNEQSQEANYKIAKNQKLPDFIGNVGNDFTSGPISKQTIDLKELKINSRYNYTQGYQNSLALQSSVILYNNGNLKKTEEKNSLLLKQYQYTTEKIKNDISLQLVGNYLTVLLNKELKIVEKNSLNTYEQQYDRNLKLYNAGSIPLSTLYESKANLANAKKSYENSIIEVDRSLMVLAMLLQKDYRGFQIEDVKISDNINSPLINVPDVVQYAFQNQPEIKSAELGIEAAKKDIDIAKTALYPTITGGYKASTSYQNFFDRSSKSLSEQWYDNHIQMLSVGVKVPIFNKGISKLQIEQSKIKQYVEENKLEQEKLTLKQNIETSYFDVNSSFQTFLSAMEAVDSNRISYEFAEKSFAAGKINVYDLNIARNNYFSAQSQMLQAKYSYLFKLKILDFYTGTPLNITSDEDLSGNQSKNQNLSPQQILSEKIESEEMTQNSSETVSSQENTNSVFNSNTQKDKSNESDYNEKKVTANSEVENIKKSTNIPASEQTTGKTVTNSFENIKENPSSGIKDDVVPANPQNMPAPETKVSDAKPASKSVDDEKAKREALIMERRAKLMKGSQNDTISNDAQREALIKERRAKLSKGL
ncbi:TolC family protein [Apibacter raozihei]|uniref:TolC family protein n=1 Tax=Apibacter raozihei TaxID=2500547 RepID=UPI000FE4007E|nr:TolC family protein [Apibacter raozihei]